MASGFGELIRQANALVAAGDLTGARNLLGPPLDGADPSPGHASEELTEAAGLQARVLVSLGDPHAARGWAAFAYSASTRLFGPADARTVASAATLAAVLHRVGSHARAARLYRDVIIELTATDGPESLRVLAAHADLATVEYAQGECTLARNRLEDAWELHREVYGDGHPGGIRMLARLGAMERDCGLFTRAHEHLALAEELCREHLSAHHPLAAQVGTLARATADPDHVCTDAGPEPPYDEPPSHEHEPPPHQHEPPPRWPEPPPQLHEPQLHEPQLHEPEFHEPEFHEPQLHERYADGSLGGSPYGAEHPPDIELPPRDEPPPLRRPPPPPRSTVGGTDAPQVPPPRLPPAPLVEPPPRWATPAPAGPAVPPPRTATDRWRLESASGPPGARTDDGPGTGPDNDPEHGWWPPDVARRSPDGEEAAGAGARSAALAAERWRPETRTGSAPLAERVHQEPPGARSGSGTDTGSGTVALAAGAGGSAQARNLPEPRSSRLPVRIHRPRPAARWNPLFVVAGLVVLVLLGTAVVALGFGLSGDDDEPAPPAPGPPTSAPAAAPATPPPASPGTPPGSVTLDDNRSSVTLGWRYPTGAPGPVVLAGGRAGQQLRPFQELPAGSTGYVVYGLDERGDFCFSVAVVYSPEVVGEAEPVCTDRPGGSPAAR
ncbi:tetratricopeptide repeat protein [Plantactinospora sp. WMMB334]|uniref:tetratricopeptide repeat protein n=1 Tax=Plantactinospora sp. WMMB334 TaxID=3404119 RepID=UPI003B944048